MWRKMVLFIGFVPLVVACTTLGRAAGPPPVARTPTAASWQTYTSTEGAFSIAYPPDYTLYQNQVPSVDGVLTEAPNSVALKRSTEPSFVLSIIYRPTNGTLSAAELAALDDACVTSSPGQPLVLGGQVFQALMFRDVPCGPHGSTLIYVNSGLMGYRIQIEASVDYQALQNVVDPILETLTFRVSNESSQVASTPEAFCTAPVVLMPADDRISYNDISLDVDPALFKSITAQNCPDIPYRDGMDLGAAHPAYTIFTFAAVRQWGGIEPEVRVYEVSDDMSAYMYPLNMLDELRKATTEKSQPVRWFDGAALHVHGRYLDFQSGAGVRGVVEYAQNIFFFTNNALIYAFDGLTGDGRYYVSARVPIQVPFLMDIERSDPRTNINPSAIPIPDWPTEYDQRRQVIDAYNQEALRRFDAMVNADFVPDLSKLDALVHSIQITAPASPSVLDQPVLEWEGYGLWGDDDATRCKTVQIDRGNKIKIGYCGEPLSATPLSRSQFGEMVQHFGPFEYQSAQEHLTFRGRGQTGAPAWQRAMLSWIHSIYTEVLTGRACASCSTVLSWYLGPSQSEASLCKHLTVLNFGYAYAEALPCAGGAVQSSNGGWLQTSEWEQIDDWLKNRAAAYPGDNYFAGEGSQPMSDAEILQLEGLAQSIYNRFDPLVDTSRSSLRTHGCSETGSVGTGCGAGLYAGGRHRSTRVRDHG